MVTEEKLKPAGPPVPVIQADREAAAAFLRTVRVSNWVAQQRYVRETLEGLHDHAGLTQYFAQHRVRAEHVGRVDGVRFGLRAAADVARHVAGPNRHEHVYERNAAYVPEAILSVSAEQLLSLKTMHWGNTPSARGDTEERLRGTRYA